MLAVLLAPSPALAQRDQFIEHLVAFQTLLAGRYGDEGPRVEDHLESMAAAVAVWDEASRVAEDELRTRAVRQAANFTWTRAAEQTVEAWLELLQ